MKKFINNIFQFLLVITVAGLTSYFIYQSYNSYKNYKIIQKSEIYLDFVQNLNSILNGLEDEQTYSALYLGYGGKIDFKKLEKLRQKTDTSIKNTNLFIDNNPVFSDYKQSLNNLSSNLQYVRSRVDVVSNEYQTILFEYYQTEIAKPILNIIKNNLDELAQGLDKLKNYLYTYYDFINFQNNTNKEKSFITYILANSKKMDKDDLKLWDNIIESQIFPSYTKLDIKTNTKLHALIDKDQLKKSIFNARSKIVNGILSGSYATNSTQWLNDMNRHTEDILKSKQILHNYLSDETSNINASPNQIIINSSVSLFLLIILISLINSIKKSKTAEKKFIRSKKRRRRLSDLKKSDDMIDISHNLQSQHKNNPLFNPIEEFESIIEEYIEKADKKHIVLSHYIDPTIPSSCIGNLKQIKQVTSNLLNHAIGTTKSYGSIKVRIENSANKENETAIRFSIIESGNSITQEYKNKIMKAFFNEEIVKTPHISTRKTDLLTTAVLVANMDGIFEINNSTKKGSTISFAVSLKKVTPKKVESLVA